MAFSSSTACDYSSTPTYERVNCALDSDLNWLPRGRMDKACALLAESLYGVGGTRFESVLRALIFLSVKHL